jgi:prophage DNA circulation protein
MGTIYEQYPIMQWKVGSRDPLKLPVISITETGGNRIVQHERGGRDGAKLDDTGAKARVWTLTILFNNSLQEKDLDETTPLYPQLLNEFVRSFDEHETGTLTLPTVGDVRARAQDYQRSETTDEDDSATVQCTFVQDNEDALDRALLSPPAVVSTIVRLAEQTTFSEQKNGSWSDDIASLTEIASEIEGLLLAPGRTVQDIGSVVRSHQHALQRIADAAEQSSDGESGDPRGSASARLLAIMLDREAQAEEERTQSRPRTKAFVIDVERTSLYEVAARLNQDAELLLELNAARIDDPFFLTRGEVIRVFETAA